MEDMKKLKTGTTTIGIVCKDGIVLAADKRATAGYMIANKKFLKIYKVADKIAVTMAGLVSDAQLITRLLKAELRLKKIRTGKGVKVKEAANLLSGIVYANVRKMTMVPGIVGFLMGGKDDINGFGLYDIGVDGSITRIDDFASTGSGSVFAYGVLETLYVKNLDVKRAADLAIKSVNAALRRDAASGEGIDVVLITEKGLERLPTKKVISSLE